MCHTLLCVRAESVWVRGWQSVGRVGFWDIYRPEVEAVEGKDVYEYVLATSNNKQSPCE